MARHPFVPLWLGSPHISPAKMEFQRPIPFWNWARPPCTKLPFCRPKGEIMETQTGQRSSRSAKSKSPNSGIPHWESDTSSSLSLSLPLRPEGLDSARQRKRCPLIFRGTNNIDTSYPLYMFQSGKPRPPPVASPAPRSGRRRSPQVATGWSRGRRVQMRWNVLRRRGQGWFCL